MPTYNSLLDALIDQSILQYTAQARLLKQELKELRISSLPASSQEKYLLQTKQTILEQAQEHKAQLQALITSINQEVLDANKVTNLYAKQTQQKGQILEQDSITISAEILKEFTNFRQFIEFGKSAKQIQQLTLNFGSQGLTDNLMEHFMHAFIKFYNINSLKLDLSRNSLTTVGARQLAGCFTNLNALESLSISLYDNKINWEGVQGLMHSFCELHNLRELHLDLSSIPMSNKGFQYVAKSLAQMRKLQSLWIILYDVGINDQSFKVLLEQMQNMHLNILKIDLRLNPFDKKLIKDLKAITTRQKLHNLEILI